MTTRLEPKLLAAAALGLVLAAHAAASTFTPPDTQGFGLDHEWDADGNGDGVKETHFVLLRDAAGDTIFSASTNGRVWAWSLDKFDDDRDPGANYVIRDSDCDGVFDEAYALDAQFHVPECVLAKAPGGAEHQSR